MNTQNDNSIEPVDNVRVLSPNQLAAITLLATGARVKDVAEQLGIHPNTVTRWSRESEAFNSELTVQKKELYHAGLQKALAVLDTHLDEGNNLEQFRAANARLQYDAQIQRNSPREDGCAFIEKLKATLLQQSSQKELEAEYTVLQSTPALPKTD